MGRWVSAFEDWLEDRKAQVKPSVWEDSILAWREFLAFTEKPPWAVMVADAEAYVESLVVRGLRPGTITKRMTGLSNFFEYCKKTEVDPECGNSFNPVKGVRRPKVAPYEKANYLSEKEEDALLEAIRKDHSEMGKRDYALILTLLRTGRRAGEVRRLKWGEFEENPHQFPEPVWEAVLEYLEAAGRLGKIEAAEYVFAPSRAPLVREAGKDARDWDGERPLSVDELHYLVKLHAKRAGLKADEITCHTLRHTATMRRIEGGEPLERVQVQLARKSAEHTKKYVRRMARLPKGRLKARRKAGEESTEKPSRGPCRTKPRNHLALTHGLYAKYLPELEALEERGVAVEGIDKKILQWRIVMRRVMALSDGEETLEEGMQLLEVMGTAAGRLERAVSSKYLHKPSKKLLKKSANDQNPNQS